MDMAQHLHASQVRCGACGYVVSKFRIDAHRRSASCALARRIASAKSNLTFVGGYESIATWPKVKLHGGRAVRVLAIGVDELGNATVIDQNSSVRQYIGGEWSFA